MCASWFHNIFTTVMTRIVVDKSTDHAKPVWFVKHIYSNHLYLPEINRVFHLPIRLHISILLQKRTIVPPTLVSVDRWSIIVHVV